MRGNRRHADGPDLRATRHLAAGVCLGTKISVLGAIRRAKGGAIHRPQGESLPRMALGILRAPRACRLIEEAFRGSLPRRCLACVTALLLMTRFVANGNARSSVASTSGLDWCRNNACAMTSHTTCSAGNLRRRILAVPLALSACSIHISSRCSASRSRPGTGRTSVVARSWLDAIGPKVNRVR